MNWRPKKAMVLAAGLGQRMRPLTETTPKPMLRLGGRPLIDHVLDRVAEAGIETAVVNVHHHADQIESHLKRRARPRVAISDERGLLLETGGGVKKALPKLGKEPFLIHNSDSLWIEGIGANLSRLSAMFDPERMDSLMLVALGLSSLGYDGRGDFVMSPDGELRRRPDRELAPFVFTGVSIAHPRLFEHAPDGPFSLNVLWDRAIEQRRLYGVRLDGVWMHVGTPKALADAERLLQGEDAA
jgi:MurNAc alpha-1-phosphate uridylyltransferase